ncbi:MAG: aldehyde dehydrogenase family protein [Cellvibrionales bacterium]|nr:aldehyde dehydrogenase family protein [Cellvibrionales bacterium]
MAIIESVSENQGKKVFSLAKPSDKKPLYDIACQTKDEVHAIIAKAKQAQKAWAALPVTDRVKHLLNLRDVIVDQQDRIMETIINETGKAKQDALMVEVYTVAAFITYWCKQAAKSLKPETSRASGIMGFTKKVHVHYKPLGVIGVIAPWNGPFVLTANPCIQAMLAGNTVVAKGSEITPFCSKILEELCLEAGIPEGVCQVLIGDGATGDALITGGVNKISFTGSVATGKKVASRCLETMTPYTLELGGKDAMIVCADAELDDAVHAAVWGSCVNTGHYCCGIERIYVHESIYHDFVSKAVEMTNNMRVGSEYGVDEDMGAVFSEQQMAIIERHVADAVDKGGKVLSGGKRLDKQGLYYPPTVVVDTDESSSLISEETFGPVLPIIKVASDQEAIAKANASKYGLHGSVWTKNKQKGIDIAKQLETGSIAINDIGMMYGIANAPFGGVKESGLGSVNGKHGLRGYCHAMPILVGRYSGKDSGYPHNEKDFENMKKMMHFMWKTTLGRLFFG